MGAILTRFEEKIARSEQLRQAHLAAVAQKAGEEGRKVGSGQYSLQYSQWVGSGQPETMCVTVHNEAHTRTHAAEVCGSGQGSRQGRAGWQGRQGKGVQDKGGTGWRT